VFVITEREKHVIYLNIAASDISHSAKATSRVASSLSRRVSRFNISFNFNTRVEGQHLRREKDSQNDSPRILPHRPKKKNDASSFEETIRCACVQGADVSAPVRLFHT
jgi:hypothetical protein